MNDSLMEVNLSVFEADYVLNADEPFGPRRDELYIVIPMTIIYIVIFITGLVGNVSTCIVIARNKSMHTATNYYLFSLAISDLLLLVSGLPPEIYAIWSRYPYVFGYTFCVARGLFAETSANATVLTITAFTIERYVAICHPFLSHTMSKLSRVIKLILFIWCVSICFAVPQAAQFDLVPMDPSNGDNADVMCHIANPIIAYSFELSTLFFFVLPMTLITVLYAMIGLRLRSSSMMKRSAARAQLKTCAHYNGNGTPAVDLTNVQTAPSANGRSKYNCRHQQSQSSRRVLKMLVAVVVAFFICWAPFHTQRLFATYTAHKEHSETAQAIFFAVTYISGILYFVSTTINPLLYNIMSHKFREAFKETFSRCCGLARLPSRRPQRSYSALSRSAQRGGHESSDSYKDEHSIHTNTTLMPNAHKNSTDSIAMNASAMGKRNISYTERDPLATARNYSRGRTEICVTMISKHNLETIQPNTRLVKVKLSRPPNAPSRIGRVWRMMPCADPHPDSSVSSIHSTPARARSDSDDEESKHRFDNKGRLKDVELDVLVDELSAYMEEIRSREVST